MARSIFLERILNKIVGSLDDILDGLADRVDDIKDDLTTMDTQLDSVKDKIDQAISAIGANLSSVYIKVEDPASNQLLVNSSEIAIPTVSSGNVTFAKFKSFADGQFFTYMIYKEGRSSNANPGAARQAYLEYRITTGGTPGSWTVLHQFYTVGSGTTPDPNRRSLDQTVSIAKYDIIEFRYTTGSSYGDNPEGASLHEFYINYSITSITDQGGAFQPQSLEAKKLEPIEPEEEPEEEAEEEAADPEEGEE